MGNRLTMVKSISQKIISEVPEKSGVEAFGRIFPMPFRNFEICSKIVNKNCIKSYRIRNM
jgi:hypothetical protein